ncbi:uncharacterized protein LOC130911089 [Corythoichthys intestinalis]|uniref:uncharacterized protein LOC130911089 n=1 Tax=Corythoichthys intestinalis TaxID=161448 RepID=UPI0025A640B5|nr:uncharacterized protein LOC130911089 [Corythoichthys intestinalis]
MDFKNGTEQNNDVYYQPQCPPLPAPPLGNHVINTGNGRSVGTTISLQCPTKHMLVGAELKCVIDANRPRWVGEPFCKSLSPYRDDGFRVAVLASIVSVGIILIMSLVFITRCILNCVQKSTREKQKRDLLKRHLEDGVTCFEGRRDANLGDYLFPLQIPDNLCDNSPPQWFAYSLSQTSSTTPPRPAGFFADQHPLPQKSDCVKAFGPPQNISFSSHCKRSSQGLIQIPT